MYIANVLVAVSIISSPAIAQQPALAHRRATSLEVQKTISLMESGEPTGSRPVFQNGYFIHVRNTVHDVGFPDVVLYNKVGDCVLQLSLRPSGAKRLLISSAALVGGSTIVASGWYVTDTGSESIPFLGTIDFNGRTLAIVKTGLYVVTQLAVASDGSIWTLGAVRPSQGLSQVRWDNYKSLQHYDSNFNLLGSYLSRWDEDVSYVLRRPLQTGSYVLDAYSRKNTLLRSYSAPLWGPHIAFATISSHSPGAWLRSTPTGGVIVFDSSSGSLYSWEPQTGILRRESVAVPDPVRIRINGVVVTHSGDLIASALEPNMNGLRASGLYKLSHGGNGLSEWAPVALQNDPTMMRTKSFLVLGADDDSVIYRVRVGIVSWAKTD